MASEARGTTRPFEFVGAPWVHAERVCRDAALLRFFPARTFARPSSSRRSRSTPGSRVAVVRSTFWIASRFKPVRVGVALIEAIRAADPLASRGRPPPYQYEHDKSPSTSCRVRRRSARRSTATPPTEAIAEDVALHRRRLRTAGAANDSPLPLRGHAPRSSPSLARHAAPPGRRAERVPRSRTIALMGDRALGLAGAAARSRCHRMAGHRRSRRSARQLGARWHSAVMDFLPCHRLLRTAEAFYQPPNGQPIGRDGAGRPRRGPRARRRRELASEADRRK